MDTTVRGIAAVVVAELRTAGYMESTIGNYAKSIKALTSFVEDRGGVYTPSLGAAFASMTVSPRTGRVSAQRRFDYGRLVRMFDIYVDTGRVELAPRKRGGGGAQPESRDFIALNSAWEADMDDRGLAPATRAAYGRIARSYLAFLESWTCPRWPDTWAMRPSVTVRGWCRGGQRRGGPPIRWVGRSRGWSAAGGRCSG
jgi:hypothetical protein